MRRRHTALLVLAALLIAAAGLSVPAGRLAPRHSHAATRKGLQRLRMAVHPVRPVHLEPMSALEARGRRRIGQLARLGLPIFCAGPHGHALALTFDDGPGPYTRLALRKLKANHDRATFFDVGRSLTYFPGYLSRELRIGVVGDHTYNHPDLAGLPRAQVYAQIARARSQIVRESGQPVDLFRPPYGAFDAEVLRSARRLGLLTVMWTQDSGDSLGANYAGIIRNVTRALRPGAIILMHENRGQTIRALQTLLPLLHRRHLRSVSLPELLATDPPSVAAVRRGAAACGGVRISAGSS
jgi:peptidoglycan/xylan/chitin deacetylase (PgdA/CDA1 family)